MIFCNNAISHARGFFQFGSRGFCRAFMAAFHYMRAIFTHCIQFGFTYGMIYSAKAYLETGDGNLLEAEAALKAGALCARTEERGKRRKKSAEEEQDEERHREKDSKPRERKIKGTSFPHILYPV